MTTTAEPRYVPAEGGSSRHRATPGLKPGRRKLLARAALHARAVEIMEAQGRIDADYLAAYTQAAREHPYLARAGEVEGRRS